MKRITKKDLIQIVTENIYEMAMDYDTVHRPHADIEKKLKSNDTPISKIPLPKSGDEPNTNFQEFLASERYRQIVNNVSKVFIINIVYFNNCGRNRIISTILNYRCFINSICDNRRV